jgi:hypothetical protein
MARATQPCGIATPVLSYRVGYWLAFNPECGSLPGLAAVMWPREREMVMWKWMILAVVSVLVDVGATAGYAQQATELSGTDYAEINRLYAMYAHAYDSADPELYASLFTSDGEFVIPGRTLKGHDDLAELAGGRGAVKERAKLFHITTSVIINPTAEGATGSAYVMLVDLARTPVISGGGVYEDVFVRTPEGWRFKKRSYFPEPAAVATKQ